MEIDIDTFKDKHGGHWGEHPEFPVSDWQHDVAENNTRLGYWEWAFELVHG